MINNITWSQYFLAVAIITGLYYLYLFKRYAKKREDITDRLDEFKDGYANDQDLNENQHHLTDILFDEAEELINKLVLKIGSISNKDQLIEALSVELKQHPALNIPSFRAGINNRIEAEIRNNGTVPMSEREIEGLW